MIITRNKFGAISSMPAEVQAKAQKLLDQAISCGKLDAPYINMERHTRHGYQGWCLNYAIYDVTAAAVLVQRRETERNKYGTSPRKDYFIVRRYGRGVRVTEAPKARVVKLARVADCLGQIIDTLEGRTKKPLKQASAFSEKEVAYKIVEERDGSYYSVYDADFEWRLGKVRIEAATNSHDGGFYVFPSIAAAKEALQQNVVFDPNWQAGKNLVLVECEISGCRYHHDNGKICVSYCRPTRVLEQLGQVSQSS